MKACAQVTRLFFGASPDLLAPTPRNDGVKMRPSVSYSYSPSRCLANKVEQHWNMLWFWVDKKVLVFTVNAEMASLVGPRNDRLRTVLARVGNLDSRGSSSSDAGMKGASLISSPPS